MKSSILLRVASFLTLIVCAGHTYGLLGAPPRNAEEAALFEAMRGFRFDVMASSRTHWTFYFGLSLFLTANLLLLAIVLWQMSSWVKTGSARYRLLIASFLAGYIVFSALCWAYFFIAPAAITSAAAACLGGAWWFAREPR